jgi:hypothetical protein
MSVYAFDLSILKYVHSVVYGEVAVGKAAVKLSAAMGDYPGVRISLSLSLSPPLLSNIAVAYVGLKVP